MLLTLADSLKTHLLADTALAGISIHVDRKFDLREIATAEMGARACGAFLAISLAGWTPTNPDGEAYWCDLNYELSFATVPHILEELSLPTFDELLACLLLSIHRHRPTDYPTAYCGHWSAGAGIYVPDDNFLLYSFPASIPIDLTHLSS